MICVITGVQKVLHIICFCKSNCIFFSEVDLLSEIRESPTRFKVFPEDHNGEVAYLFNPQTGQLKTSRRLSQQFIMAIESNKEFIIVANIKIDRPTSAPQNLFYIANSRSNREILGLHVMGVRGKGEIGLRYRTNDDDTELITFREATQVTDGHWHRIYLHVVDDKHKASFVSLYVDCEPIGASRQTAFSLGSVFSNEGVKGSRIEMRIGQRGSSGEIRAKWQVRVGGVLSQSTSDLKEAVLCSPHAQLPS